MQLQNYYADMRAKRAELSAQFPSGYCYVMSLANRDRNSTAGNIAEVCVDTAARTIIEGTHRLTTADELTEHLEVQDANRRRDALGALAISRAQFQSDLIKRNSR